MTVRDLVVSDAVRAHLEEAPNVRLVAPSATVVGLEVHDAGSSLH